MEVKITGDFIKLGQLIKKLNIVDTGGATKHFIETHNIMINDVKPKGRNTKVFPNSIVWIDDEMYKIVN
ncbi:MAG: RNA-binding S4 domain-containing protein [Metamycoplasmataceae bacterium]